MESSSQKAIIITDDDQGIREAIGEYLMQIGYKVFKATHVNDALDYPEKHRVDLVITAFYKSDMNGFDFSKRVKNQYKIPVVVFSGYGYSDEEVIASGADLI